MAARIVDFKAGRTTELRLATKKASFQQKFAVESEHNIGKPHICNVRKECGWWSKKHDGHVSPDSPPWVENSTLLKSYSLLHADVGAAADHRKRRYVIRSRAEENQFLLSCFELGTFVSWLDGLSAAINIAAPIDERDFPRDQTVPRIVRIRWLRGERPQHDEVKPNMLSRSA
ncbi:hypothetical protein B0T25DRAFT_603461 [Lasiosphaeria hispida]|uniref:PH domain-containing protein n=1 Tax=Lasiosphaeria hispida TaxID=260671 RepID=A0AAJ0MFK5_9PEZI|nr:hypothetical protein B0T25DRAFT_603461 [Lasiosphaeria hispida]